MRPPDPILLAAKRWLDILPTSGGIRRAQALLTTHTEFSDLTPTQYATALAWLNETGLLTSESSPAPSANQVLSAILEESAPPWVKDADALVHSPDELPSDLVTTGAVLGLNADGVYEQVVSSWGKVDTAARKRVGAAGEAALVSLLSDVPGSLVDHVAAWSDGFGYDISFTRGPSSAHLEVKSTTRSGRLSIYLSRHEYEVMLRDPCWILVAVRLTSDLEVSGVGSVPSSWLKDNAPHDASGIGRWESCKFEVPATVITGGIPQLGRQVAPDLPSW
ncbi:uncharacterized protein DUF3883 [Nocardiopsis sp. Huas11]|uniref:DUF3883 domain-containing protein n=1 Tax=Nocardiopsis sp. Huas11 TaxID=2183912 RepID=UPI000F266A98|nr:DUF3883 domain-containing protein [Nocardiopsis sp. Huas11]RKS05901.1 uncharacterized protein DUF3883 [Nocardiopsis sp. Huas11]